MTTLLLALADSAASVYLVVYGLRRERRNKARVLIVGGMLAVCAVALVVIGWPKSTSPPSAPTPLAPAGVSTSV